ncbi:glycosyl hydrolase family 16 [Trichoderma arundinaceum]|uniref:chitinase n=1 Tax=Trichoderma arundinaceum TaxID=490622 RepID=A0A395NIX1_TRIAR|nr:glycosyl hydrolase family 16 [Trichoderma arundinaceum]
MRYLRGLLAAAPLLGLASAQVSTSCNPLNSTECPTDPGFNTDYTFYFNSTPSYELWETTAGSVQYDSENGAAFTINKQGDSPTIRTLFYFFFGRVELFLKVAPGVGIVSSAMWLSDDLDEVDWEFLGVNNTQASTNYFGKGYEDYHNGGLYTTANNQENYINYTTVWTKESIDWFIDGQHVRTLTPEAANKTRNYPQTPMRLSLGIWAGGDPRLPNGTREWAGGNTDYSKGPFTMYVKSARITDYGGGSEYAYGDMTGSWQSIKVTGGNSTFYEALHQAPKLSVAQKWNNLPAGARIAVYVAAGVVGAVLIGALLFYCIKQRQSGAREARLANEMEKMDRMELDKLKREGVDPDAYTDYDSRSMRKEGVVTSDAPPIGVSPLDSKGWSAVNIESPMQSPAPFLIQGAKSPTASGFDSAQTDHPGSPGSPAPSHPGPNRASSTAAPIRNFSASHSGYQGIPGGEV